MTDTMEETMKTTPEALARALGITAPELRGWLRDNYPSRAPGKGGRWEISVKMIVMAARFFR